MEQKFKSLPQQIQKLLPTPVFEKPNFNHIRSQNSKNISLSVKTNTLISLSQPPIVYQPQTNLNNRPIILLFCQPSQQIYIDQDKIFPYTPISYANWLQGAGAHCIPLPYNINQGSIQFLLQRSHGLLIPGGGSNLYKNFFKKQGQGPVMIGFMKILRFIQKMWNKGVYYPIWGTCLGFQMMLIALTNDTKVLSNLNSRAHQLQIYSDYQNSKLLKKMPLSLRFKAQNNKLINFQHSFGISVNKFINYSKLTQKLKISQISKDKDGKWFCSGLQGKQNPIFLTQYHPQKQAYQWTKNGDIIHTQDSIQISHYLVTSFIEQCKKCKAVKQFGNLREQCFYLIQNYKQIHTPNKMYKVYAIDFKYRQYDKQIRKEMKNDRSISTSSNTKSMVKKPFI